MSKRHLILHLQQASYVYLCLPEQCWLLQISVSIPLPTQSLPLYCGFGSEHDLIFFFVPPPHVTVQSSQELHSAHAPSTERKPIGSSVYKY